MSKIKIAIIGIGNCASSLIQGIHYYRDKKPEIKKEVRPRHGFPLVQRLNNEIEHATARLTAECST